MKDFGLRLAATAGHCVDFAPQNRRSRPIRSYRALEDLAFAYAGLGRKTEAIRYPGVSPCPGNRQGHLTSVSLASIEVETSGNCRLQSGQDRTV